MPSLREMHHIIAREVYYFTLNALANPEYNGKTIREIRVEAKMVSLERHLDALIAAELAETEAPARKAG